VKTVALGTLLLGLAHAADPPIISVKESSELVLTMLKVDGWTQLPGFTLESAGSRVPSGSPDYHLVNASWDNPGGGNAIGHYAVDQATGEIWDWVGCVYFTSPALTKAQEAIRHRIGLSSSEYQRVRKNAPWCDPGQKPLAIRMGRPMWGLK
jgi:hypothetical protein